MSVYELGLLVNLVIMAGLIVAIFAPESAIVYNGKSYPVSFDYASGRVSCKLFGGVKRYIRPDNKYNVFGVVCEVR